MSMGFWDSIRLKFKTSSVSSHSSEILVYSGVRVWVSSILKDTILQSGFEMKSREYIDFLHAQVKLFSSYDHGGGRAIAELLKDTKMSVEDFLYLHEETRRFLLDGNLRREQFKELHNKVDVFEDFLVQSKIRSILLLVERVGLLDEYCESLSTEQKALEAKLERLNYARGIVIGKQEEFDLLQRDLGMEMNLGSERISRLHEEELSIVRDLTGFFSSSAALFEMYCAQHGNSFENAELLRKYQRDPSMLLVQDKNLEILRVFDEIILGVEKKNLGSGVDDLEFIILEIKRIDLSRMAADLIRIYADLKRKPMMDGAIKYKLEDLKYRMAHFQSQVDILNSQVLVITDRINELRQLHAREISLFENIFLKSFGRVVVIEVPVELQQENMQ